MLDRETVKAADHDEIAAIGDAECVAIVFYELIVPGCSIVQVVGRGRYQECHALLEQSESPRQEGPFPIIKNAYAGVMTAEKWAQKIDDDAKVVSLPVPGNRSIN